MCWTLSKLEVLPAASRAAQGELEAELWTAPAQGCWMGQWDPFFFQAESRPALPSGCWVSGQIKAEQSSAVIADPDAMHAIKHELFLTMDCRLCFSEFKAVPSS